MGLFIASLVPLVAGPLLVRLLQSARWAARLLDAFVVISVGGLIFVHILPHAIARGGVLAMGATALGLLLPTTSSKLLHGRKDLARQATVVLGLLALGLHATIDGVALTAPHHHHEHGLELAVAVVLHRLPVGLGIWWLVRPRFGLRVAVLTVASIVMMTTVGYLWGHRAAGLSTGVTASAVQALVAGSLIHVVLGHRHTPAQTPPSGRWRPASAFGALAALALLVGLSHGHEALRPDSATLGAGETFVALALVSAPALLLAYILIGLIHGLLPEQPLGWLRRRSTASQAAVGTVIGLPLSICSCSVIALYRRLVERGVPSAAALALLVAAPEIGVATVLLSLQLLGLRIGLARIAAAVLLALLVGAWIGTQARRQPSSDGAPALAAAPRSVRSRVTSGLRYGFGELADHTLPWFLVGLGVAALLEPLVRPGALAALPWGLDVPMMALVGLPLYVCATASTPLAALLVHKGLSPGGAIAFLLAGPAMNIATYRLLGQLHGRKLALRFGAAVAALSIAAGLGTNLLLGSTSVALHDMAASAGHGLNAICLAVIVVLLLVSLLRQGVEGFVAQVLERHGQQGHHRCEPGEHDHDHGHGREGPHGHGHAHGQRQGHEHA